MTQPIPIVHQFLILTSNLLFVKQAKFCYNYSTMRVGMYYANSDVRVQQMPVPKINEGELLVRIHASGICGSDVMEWYRAGKVPLVLGH